MAKLHGKDKTLRVALLGGETLLGRELQQVLESRTGAAITGYAAAFIHLLELLKKGEGTDVVEIGEEHEGALRLVTDTYAPA